MANFDTQLSRMEYLMGYRMPVNENANSGNIEYHTKGADGKIYGIIKEGTKYYIKTATEGKENITESYDYINGFNNRKETEYKSYNEASKQLELRLMSLNEAYGVHEDVSIVDFNRGAKVMATLTEEARKELNRVSQIMENSNNIGIKSNIGDHGNPEGKGTSTGAETVKNNKPFDEKATAKLDKDFTEKLSDAKNTDSNYDNVSKNVEAELQSDKMKKGTDTAADDMEDAKVDLDGTSVAAEHPTGAKAVKVNVNEGHDFDDVIQTDADEDIDDDFYGFNDGMPAEPIEEPVDEPIDDNFGHEEPVESPEVGDDIVGTDEEGDDDLDSLMEEFDSIIAGNNKALESNMGTSPVLTWDKMNESQKKAVDTIVESVCNKIFNKKAPAKKMTNESKLKNTIDRIVKEEVTKLDAWGKHPKYGKEPMTTPENPNGDGKKVGTASKDWNDTSAKGSQKYGQKIGNGAPFNQVVDMLTDSVMKMLKENISLKKN